VTFRYRASDSRCWQRLTVTAEEFLRRFLQHVLPKGFVKVRYYGLFSPSRRYLLPLIHLWLDTDEVYDPLEETERDTDTECSGIPCPICGHPMRWMQRVRPRGRCPPRVG